MVNDKKIVIYWKWSILTDIAPPVWVKSLFVFERHIPSKSQLYLQASDLSFAHLSQGEALE